MAKKQNPTSHEHFVSVGYLNAFAKNNTDSHAKNKKKRDQYIYQYNLKNHQASNDAVPIKSICYIDDLYEPKDDCGNYVARNYSELSLKGIEDAFYKVRNSIIGRQNVVNFNKTGFLTSLEHGILCLMIATQILRHPTVLGPSKELSHSVFADTDLKPHQKELLAHLYCLPMWNLISEQETSPELLAVKRLSENPPLLMDLCNKLLKLNIRIGYCSKKQIFTCDQPVYTAGEQQGFNIKNVIYPISPQLVVFLYEPIFDIKNHNNEIILLSNNLISYVNECIVLSAKEWIYNYDAFSDKQRSFIIQARSHRSYDFNK